MQFCLIFHVFSSSMWIFKNHGDLYTHIVFLSVEYFFFFFFGTELINSQLILSNKWKAKVPSLSRVVLARFLMLFPSPS